MWRKPSWWWPGSCCLVTASTSSRMKLRTTSCLRSSSERTLGQSMSAWAPTFHQRKRRSRVADAEKQWLKMLEGFYLSGLLMNERKQKNSWMKICDVEAWCTEHLPEGRCQRDGEEMFIVSDLRGMLMRRLHRKDLWSVFRKLVHDANIFLNSNSLKQIHLHHWKTNGVLRAWGCFTVRFC